MYIYIFHIIYLCFLVYKSTLFCRPKVEILFVIYNLSSKSLSLCCIRQYENIYFVFLLAWYVDWDLEISLQKYMFSRGPNMPNHCQLKMELCGDENEHNFNGEKRHFFRIFNNFNFLKLFTIHNYATNKSHNKILCVVYTLKQLAILYDIVARLLT